MAGNEEVDSLGRLKACAHCGETNQFVDEDAKYCIHCGFSLKNQCTNYNECGAQLPPHAAYCPYCGSESHFLRSKLIKSTRRIIIDDDDLPF